MNFVPPYHRKLFGGQGRCVTFLYCLTTQYHLRWNKPDWRNSLDEIHEHV